MIADHKTLTTSRHRNAIRGAVLGMAMIFILSGVLPAVGWAAERMIPATFSDVAAKASPAVVNISTVNKSQKIAGEQFKSPFGKDDPFNEFYERFFGGQRPRPMPKSQALGTGFIIDPAGYIITNNHVVENAEKITVRMSDGREMKAELLGRDPKTDLALLKIEHNGELPYLNLGDSNRTNIGDWVVAIGNPFGLEHTVTSGILSAKGRVIGAGPYDDFLQTDASINPGNSGGPLLNLDGEVIGINTAIVAQGQGIGFAIPSDLAKGIFAQLKEKGRVVRGWLGVMIQPVTAELAKTFGVDDAAGALVADVTPGGPAEKSGLKRGDVVVSFNGREVKESSDLPAIVAGTPVGSSVKVEVIREGKPKTITVKLGELKEEQVASLTAAPEKLGLTVQELTPERAAQMNIDQNKGVIIVNIADESPAADSGLKPGDLIREINRKPIVNLADYQSALSKIRAEEMVLMLIQRGENTLYFTLEA